MLQAAQAAQSMQAQAEGRYPAEPRPQALDRAQAQAQSKRATLFTPATAATRLLYPSLYGAASPPPQITPASLPPASVPPASVRPASAGYLPSASVPPAAVTPAAAALLLSDSSLLRRYGRGGTTSGGGSYPYPYP